MIYISQTTGLLPKEKEQNHRIHNRYGSFQVNLSVLPVLFLTDDSLFLTSIKPYMEGL
jgi:hypothetical protein